ncbi:MAG: hypothetical protein EOP49_03740 [Sphingobacteriales bacterium]|nr:MAG: hypothetical protein EOP49_03740 [Sphingobacteriales bacterium]
MEDGAKVYISDINEAKIRETVDKFRTVEVVAGDAIFDLEMDIYAPCALGATVNSESLAKMKCPIIAGAANNQLADENVHGPMVIEKGILYAPDFLINAGGLINVAAELDGYNRERVMGNVEKIYERTLDIYALSESEKIHTQAAAMRIAEKRLQDIANVKARL